MKLIRIFRETFNEVLTKQRVIIDGWFDKVQRKYYEKSINELKRLYDDRAAEYKRLIDGLKSIFTEFFILSPSLLTSHLMYLLVF